MIIHYMTYSSNEQKVGQWRRVSPGGMDGAYAVM